MSTTAYPHHTDPGAPGAPIAFLFHGTGGDETQLSGLGRDLLPGATRIAPRGDVDEAGGRRFFRRFAEGRYDMADLARATAKMAGFVAAHKAAHPGARVIGLGYSNGANILASVIFAHRALLDDAVLLHPLIAWEPEPGSVATRVMITAGARDPICPVPLTRQLEGWFRDQGGEVGMHMHPGGHGIEASEIAAIRAFLDPAETPGAGPF